MKAAVISGIKRANILNTKLMSLQCKVRTRTLEINGYQPRSNLVIDGNSDLPAASHDI
jgi:hypothetical protein